MSTNDLSAALTASGLGKYGATSGRKQHDGSVPPLKRAERYLLSDSALEFGQIVFPGRRLSSSSELIFFFIFPSRPRLVAVRALMILTFSPRSVCATTRSRPDWEVPTVTYRFFFPRVIRIVVSQRQRIAEHRGGLVKRDAVLPYV